MVQVRKAQRITEEEDWRAVADDVPVAFLGVELQGEAADVTLGISRPALAGDGRKAGAQGCLLAHLGEDLRLGVADDVVRDGEGAVGSPALGIHAALLANFAIEVSPLLDQPDVLDHARSARPGRLDFPAVPSVRSRSVGSGCNPTRHDA